METEGITNRFKVQAKYPRSNAGKDVAVLLQGYFAWTLNLLVMPSVFVH